MDPDEDEQGDGMDLDREVCAIIQEMVRQALHQGTGTPFIMTIALLTPGGGRPAGYSGENPADDHPIEVFRQGEYVILQIGLPGAEPGGISIGFGNGSVRITAQCGDTMVRSTASVPPPELGTITVSFHNGILEITYRERGSRQENPQGTPVDT